MLKNLKYVKPKIHLFLDLDNTIINALTPDEIEYAHKNGFEPEKYFAYHDFKIDGKLFYRIYERPNLQLFLDFIFELFDISVFTAANNDYASFIVKNIIRADKKRKINYFFYSLHSEITVKYLSGLKDLNLLWNVYNVPDISMDNTLILDDNPDVYKCNKYNCIVTPSFHIINDDTGELNTSSINDVFLLKVAPKILLNIDKKFKLTNKVN
jgi:TFIIF-interacting CTD phosphatase-like protein